MSIQWQEVRAVLDLHKRRADIEVQAIHLRRVWHTSAWHFMLWAVHTLQRWCWRRIAKSTIHIVWLAAKRALVPLGNNEEEELEWVCKGHGEPSKEEHEVLALQGILDKEIYTQEAWREVRSSTTDNRTEEGDKKMIYHKHTICRNCPKWNRDTSDEPPLDCDC